jgi:hypothetical protein
MEVAMITKIRDKYKSLSPVLEERSQRFWAASEALSIG